MGKNRLSFLPDTFTMFNAIMGLLAVFFAYKGEIRVVYVLLIGAALFDKLDGAMARKLSLSGSVLQATPPPRVYLGRSLDNIADAVSFCIAPAWTTILSYLCSGLMIFASFLMNLYSVRYIHLGRFMDRHPWCFRITFMLGLFFVFTPYFGQVVLLYLFLYTLSPLLFWHISPDGNARKTKSIIIKG